MFSTLSVPNAKVDGDADLSTGSFLGCINAAVPLALIAVDVVHTQIDVLYW